MNVMSKPIKYIVWIKCRYSEEGYKLEPQEQIWEEQGDGPLTAKQAERIASEISHDFGIRTKILPVGSEPIYA
jgi:hypothetical protein